MLWQETAQFEETDTKEAAGQSCKYCPVIDYITLFKLPFVLWIAVIKLGITHFSYGHATAFSGIGRYGII